MPGSSPHTQSPDHMIKYTWYTHVLHMVDLRIVRVQIQDSVPSRHGHLPDHPAHSGLWPAGDLKHCKALQFITALEGAPFTAQ